MSALAEAIAMQVPHARPPVFGRKLLILTSQIALVAFAYYASLELRFEFNLPRDVRHIFLDSLLIVIGVKLFSFYCFGLVRGWWRYVGISDLLDITKAALASSASLAVLLLAVFHFEGFPRSIIGIDCLMTILVVGGARFALRAYTEAVERHAGEKSTLIVGAGPEAASLVRDLRQSAHAGCNPVAIVDDDVTKIGIKIHGVKVVGTTDSLASVVARHDIKCVLIALPSPTNKQVQRIIENCRSSRVEFKILPTLDNRINGHNVLGLLRNIDAEDLLGRAPVSLDIEAIRNKLQDKVVLITGAAGSIGSELAR